MLQFDRQQNNRQWVHSPHLAAALAGNNRCAHTAPQACSVVVVFSSMVYFVGSSASNRQLNGVFFPRCHRVTLSYAQFFRSLRTIFSLCLLTINFNYLKYYTVIIIANEFFVFATAVAACLSRAILWNVLVSASSHNMEDAYILIHELKPAFLCCLYCFLIKPSRNTVLLAI